MKNLITMLLLMTNLASMAQNGKAVTIKKTFSRETIVKTEINADVSIIWALLTNGPDFSRWNSTIVSLDGNIQEGEKIRLVSTLDPDRTFKIKIKAMTPEKEMIWGDAMGKRVYSLEKSGEGKVVFSMREKIGSFMFPLFANKIPPFDGAFEQFAADLKKEAEMIQGD